MSSLSDRQRRILKFIIDYTAEHDFPPSIREIGERVGITSTSVVNYNLTKLEEMELLSREREVSRGLSLNRARLAEIGFLLAENGGCCPAQAPNGTNGGGTVGQRARADLGQDCRRCADPGGCPGARQYR